LLAQEIHVFLAVAQALLCGTELVGEELFGFGDWVREHDVGLGREGWRLVNIHFLVRFVRWRKGSFGMQGVMWARMFEHTPSQR